MLGYFVFTLQVVRFLLRCLICQVSFVLNADSEFLVSFSQIILIRVEIRSKASLVCFQGSQTHFLSRHFLAGLSTNSSQAQPFDLDHKF